MSLVDVADDVWRDGDRKPGFLHWGNQDMISTLLPELARRVPEGERAAFLVGAATDGLGLGMLCLLRFILARSEPGVGERLADAIAPVLVSRIERAASDGSLLRVKGLQGVLEVWRTGKTEPSAQAWVRGVLSSSPKDVATLVGAFSSRPTSTQNGVDWEQRGPVCDPVAFEHLVPASEVAAAVKRSLEDKGADLDAEQRKVLEGYNLGARARAEGMTPTDPRVDSFLRGEAQTPPTTEPVVGEDE